MGVTARPATSGRRSGVAVGSRESAMHSLRRGHPERSTGTYQLQELDTLTRRGRKTKVKVVGAPNGKAEAVGVAQMGLSESVAGPFPYRLTLLFKAINLMSAQGPPKAMRGRESRSRRFHEA